MSRFRKHLTFSNVLASVAIFLALGGSAYAVSKNSIGTAQLKKNAVTAQKIKKNAVTTAKVKNNTITTAKVRNGAITGSKVAAGAIDSSKLAPGTLENVPSAKAAQHAATAAKADVANTATTAQNLVGQETFFLKLQVGQEKPIAQNGGVSLYARCQDEGSDRYIYVFAKTTLDGAILAADDYLEGGTNPSDFLNVSTPEYDRVWEYTYSGIDRPYVTHEIDSGVVLGPDGKGLVASSEGIIMGLNYLGADCLTAGVVNAVG